MVRRRTTTATSGAVPDAANSSSSSGAGQAAPHEPLAAQAAPLPIQAAVVAPVQHQQPMEALEPAAAAAEAPVVPAPVRVWPSAAVAALVDLPVLATASPLAQLLLPLFNFTAEGGAIECDASLFFLGDPVAPWALSSLSLGALFRLPAEPLWLRLPGGEGVFTGAAVDALADSQAPRLQLRAYAARRLLVEAAQGRLRAEAHGPDGGVVFTSVPGVDQVAPPVAPAEAVPPVVPAVDAGPVAAEPAAVEPVAAVPAVVAAPAAQAPVEEGAVAGEAAAMLDEPPAGGDVAARAMEPVSFDNIVCASVRVVTGGSVLLNTLYLSDTAQPCAGRCGLGPPAVVACFLYDFGVRARPP